MVERSSSEITIKRPTSNGTSDVATVPITANSVRSFTLMQDDSIKLNFTLATALHFAIGDFIEDELFGKFVIVNEQMPNYNVQTGGYDYSLVFKAEYYVWGNLMHCMVADGERMEASWSLTERLSVQATQIVENLNALGITGYSVNVTAENAAEVKCLTFNGVTMLNAMQQMADAWSCEWWVVGKVINFGKCENGTELTFTLGGNVESMTIANNRKSFANRIFAFGGTQNIPEDYDRSLVFKCDKIEVVEGTNLYCDSTRPLDKSMIGGVGTPLTYRIRSMDNVSAVDTHISLASDYVTINGGDYSQSGFIEVYVSWEYGTAELPVETRDISARAYIEVEGQTSVNLGSQYFNMRQTTKEEHVEATVSFDLPSELSTSANGYIRFVVDLYGDMPTNEFSTSASMDCTLTGSEQTVSQTLYLTFEENDYQVTLNPTNAESGALRHYFSFDDSAPSGFGIGSEFTMHPLTIDVPYSYYTADYSVGTLSKVGAKRLHLPLEDYPNRYMDSSESVSPTQVVEEAVVFNDVFPKLKLKITSVRQVMRRDVVEHEDGSITYENWPQYYFSCAKENGDAFVFSTRYLLTGEKLTAHFLTPTTIENQNGFRLAGMTFDVGFTNSSQEYCIIRNENYGVSLPEGDIKPSVGDTFFLAGWNPKAITGLGLVEDAEDELVDKAEEYLDAIEEGQFTFTCKMMSDWPFSFYGELPLFTSEDEQFEENDELWFYVKNGFDYYQIPIEGAKITISHPALSSGGKTSRVIGYEFRLDMPWDSPTYIVGETQAFSRLAKIEKEITKLT